MIDLKQLRENPALFKKACESKNVIVDIDSIVELDKENRSLKNSTDQLRYHLKKQSKSKPSPQDIERLKKLGEEIKNLETKQEKIQKNLDELLYKIPNIPTQDTPVGKDENSNVVIKVVGNPPKFHFKPKEHWELGSALNLIDTERAAKISGTRFAYLKNELALIQFGLIQFAFFVITNEKILKKIIKASKLAVSSKPFVPVIPPALVRAETLHKMGRLEPKEERYYIPSDDQYLIGSAEHALGPLYMDEIFEETDLPVRLAGYSTSFRREAGSYGKDVKGIIRLHQFDKLELESFTVKETSMDEHFFLIAIEEYLMQSLEIPYRLVQACTGDVGNPNARRVDVEAWIPGQGRYLETHSADYMTDFQARRLQTRVKRKNGKIELVHTNDATAFAIGRTLVAIMENYQKEDGTIRIPHVLKKYINKMTKIEGK